MTIATRLLRECAAGEAWRVSLGLALLFGASAAALLQPWPLKLVVDAVLGDRRAPTALSNLAGFVQHHSPWPVDAKFALLFVLCGCVLAIQVLIGLLNVASTYVLVAAGLRMVFKLRCRTFDHLQRMSLSFHDRTAVGDSLYRVTWDTYCVQSLFNGGIVPAVTAIATLVGITVIMALLDPVVTVAALSIGAPLLLLIRRLDRPMTSRSLHVHERDSAISTRVQEALTGIRAVQAFGREDFESTRFRDHADASLRANLLLTVLQAGSQAAVGLLLAAGTALVVLIGATRAIHGHLTVGDVVLIVAYVAMLYKPLETLAYTAATLQGATAGARRVYGVLDTEPAVTDAPDARELPHRAQGRVTFEEVSFGYLDDRKVLDDISLDVAPATTVALVGASGAGKTKLMSLLLRFYDTASGRVMLDGQDLRGLSLRSVRSNLALVLQEPILFSASLRENIAYGRPAATLEEIKAAARAADADRFIEALPAGYETQIGERGVMLSGGQRQRLSIARAFLKDAPVLIMDEPTSALDPETEQSLLRSLAALKQGRTTFIIAHRLSTIRDADRIAVLESGRLIEQGTHAELLDRASTYRRLYTMQFGD
ncbi:MAG: ABC transporter ATP-binding protein, partial [Dehalococcoidia bacterium]